MRIKYKYSGVLKILDDVYDIKFNEYPSISDDAETDLFVFSCKSSEEKKYKNVELCTLNLFSGDVLIFYFSEIKNNSINFKECELITRKEL